MNRALVRRWLPFAVATGGALTLWGLAAAQGYGWAMIWLPAAVAGAAWPRRDPPPYAECRRRVGTLRRGR
jgi:hypothetical protein